MTAETEGTINEQAGFAKEKSPELSPEEQEVILQFMKDGIFENEVFVSHALNKLEERIAKSEKSDMLQKVYQRIKHSSTPSIEKVTEEEQQYIQAVWKSVCAETVKNKGEYRTSFNDFEPFRNSHDWFTAKFNEYSEGFGEWLRVLQPLDLNGIDGIVFRNKRYGAIAYDLYRAGSTDIKFIIETLIN